MGMVVHMVSVMVIVVARDNGVIVVVTVWDNYSTILSCRWAAVAWIIVGIVAIPHVDSLVVGIGITPGGCSIINLHLSADGRRGRLFPASGLHVLVLFASVAPARRTLLYRARATP